jgi:hypothetical protein
MANSQIYPKQLDMPVSAGKDPHKQAAKRFINAVIEAEIDFKKGTRYSLASQKKPFDWR